MVQNTQTYLQKMIVEIYQYASQNPDARVLTEDQLYLIGQDIIPALLVAPIRGRLISGGHIRQVRANPIEFEITAELIDSAETFLESSRSSTQSSFRRFRDELLIGLARTENTSGPDFYDLKDVAEETGLAYSEGWVRKAAYDFRDRGLIREAFTMGGGTDDNLSASLTGEGLAEAERLMDEMVDSAAQLPNSPSPSWDEAKWDEIRWANEAPEGGNARKTPEVGLLDSTGQPFSLDSSRLRGIPASDRVVQLDHNGAEYKEAILSLDEVIATFKDDHSLDNELGQEKPALEKALEGGRGLLNDTRIRIESAVALILRPLQIVAKRYEEVLVGALAATALTVVAKLLGLL